MHKVPVVALVRAAYGDVASNWRGLVRIGAVWVLVLCAMLILAWDSPAALAMIVPSSFAMIAVAVAWHRHVLEDLPLTVWTARIDGRVLRYAWRSFLCTVVAVVITVVAGGILAVPFILQPAEFDLKVLDRPSVAGPVFGPMIAAGAYVLARLQLVLPAAAIRDGITGFVRSWQITKGNGWRLTLGFALTWLPLGLAAKLLSELLAGLANESGSIVARGLSALIWYGGKLLCAAVFAAFLSLAYRWFRERATVAPT